MSPEVNLESYAIQLTEAYHQAIEEMKKPYPSVPFSEWKGMQAATGGLRPREFSIFCGSTGSGKTQFMSALSSQLLKQGVKHFVMSVETGHTDFVKRVMSNLAGMDLNTGDPVAIDVLAKITLEFAPLIVQDTLRLSIYDNRVSVDQLMWDLTKMANAGYKVAIVDNINFFMEVTRAADQIIEMDRTIHELIILCKHIDMHVIMIMHPRKTEGTRVESEFDIKGSSTAVQEAHNVFLFNRPRLVDIQSLDRKITQRELKIAKMRRRGKFVGRTILFEYENSKYKEVGFI